MKKIGKFIKAIFTPTPEMDEYLFYEEAIKGRIVRPSKTYRPVLEVAQGEDHGLKYEARKSEWSHIEPPTLASNSLLELKKEIKARNWEKAWIYKKWVPGKSAPGDTYGTITAEPYRPRYREK